MSRTVSDRVLPDESSGRAAPHSNRRTENRTETLIGQSLPGNLESANRALLTPFAKRNLTNGTRSLYDGSTSYIEGR